MSDQVLPLGYEEFCLRATRVDKNCNDRQHFFSQVFHLRFAYLFYRLGLSPNQVTIMFLALGILSVFCFYLDFVVLGYVFWRLHIVVDMADGSIARATKNFSVYAIGFDRSNHIVINTSILIAIIYDYENWLLANFLLIAFYLNYFFSRNYYMGKQTVRTLSIRNIILKDALGLEGLVALYVLCSLLRLEMQFEYVVWSYSIFFLVFYFEKLRRFKP